MSNLFALSTPNPPRWNPADFISKRYVILITAVMACMLFAAGGPASGADRIVILFYSAEANINNYKTLKAEFDGYLSRFGPYEFQPFGEQAVFEQRLRETDRCLLLFSAWHYRKITENRPLAPLLAGTRDGSSYQKRILVSAVADNLGTEPIASAGNLQLTRSILAEMFPAKNPSAFNILMVPKEIDALVSLSFESATYALVTESAKGKLQALDPVLSERLKTLAEGKPSLLPVLAAPAEFAAADELVKIIMEMPKSSEGKNIMQFLDLDGWKVIGPSEKSNLEG